MFPKDMTLDEVSRVVREHNEALEMNVFIEADRGDHVIFNYLLNFEGVFPDFVEGDEAENRRVGILRECRGLIFDKETGLVIARRFHKFWNLNQRPETQVGVIEWSRPHVIMDKLDGSMVTPFRPTNGIRRWGTKMGATGVAEPIEAHVADRSQYEELAVMCEAAGFTPIFEWCSRQQRIVIDYPEDKLVLTHLRNISTGEYATREQVRELGESYDIPVVETLESTIEDIDAFVEHTRKLKNLEGYVVHFEGDLLLKLKAEEYCMLHNTKEKLNLEKNVIEMILSDGIDDMLPQLDAGDRAAVTAYHNDLMEGVANAAREVIDYAILITSGCGVDPDADDFAKAFALLLESKGDFPHRFFKSLVYKARVIAAAIFSGARPEDYGHILIVNDILNVLKKQTGSGTKVEEARPLFGGIEWINYRGEFDGDA